MLGAGEIGARKGGEANMNGGRKPDFTDRNDVRRFIIAKMCEFATMPPEKTKGTLSGQIKACRDLYVEWGYQPALRMLGQIANVDTSRTNGRSRDQEAAAKLQKRFLTAIKVTKSIQ